MSSMIIKVWRYYSNVFTYVISFCTKNFLLFSDSGRPVSFWKILLIIFINSIQLISFLTSNRFHSGLLYADALSHSTWNKYLNYIHILKLVILIEFKFTNLTSSPRLISPFCVCIENYWSRSNWNLYKNLYYWYNLFFVNSRAAQKYQELEKKTWIENKSNIFVVELELLSHL